MKLSYIYNSITAAAAAAGVKFNCFLFHPLKHHRVTVKLRKKVVVICCSVFVGQYFTELPARCKPSYITLYNVTK